MIKKKITIIMVSTLLLLTMGCKSITPPVSANAKNLMDGVKPEATTTAAKLTKDEIKNLNKFSSKLFLSIFDDKNTLVSPLSIMGALGMTANGANNDTRDEFVRLFGATDIEAVNNAFANYIKSLPSHENYKFNIANSIWINDNTGFKPNIEFLQTNANYYNAELYEATFNKKTQDEINSWVNKNTDGMIPTIIDQIDDGTIMYLINALSFDAEWHRIYNEGDIFTDVFYDEEENTEEVEFMFSKERKYLEGKTYTGFIKDYKDGKYSFVALLPNEGINMRAFISDLDYEKMYEDIKSPEDIVVHATMPKFSYSFDTPLVKPLENMGLLKAFNSDLADFSNMGTSENEDLFVGNVIHKTFIDVNEKGTRAGAATAVVMETTSAPMDIKTIVLNRPFMYMIIDKENGLPMFVGTLMNTK